MMMNPLRTNTDQHTTYFWPPTDIFEHNVNELLFVNFSFCAAPIIANYPTLHPLLTHTQRETYKLEAMAQDKGYPPLSRTVEVQIDVVDRANNPPVWDHVVYGPIYVKENMPVGGKVVSVKARSVLHDFCSAHLFLFGCVRSPSDWTLNDEPLWGLFFVYPLVSSSSSYSIGRSIQFIFRFIFLLSCNCGFICECVFVQNTMLLSFLCAFLVVWGSLGHTTRTNRSGYSCPGL